MINLETFFESHFDTPKISDDKMKRFTFDHIQRIISNNGSGVYNTMLNATVNAYNSYFGAINDEDTKEAVQQSRTIIADAFFNQFIKTVQQKEGTIKGLYGKGSAAYEEFFPHGMSEYDQATKANIEMLMARMVNASTAHQADLGLAFVTIFTDLQSNYHDAYVAQHQQFGTVDASKTVTSVTRDVVEIQVGKNVLTLAIEFFGNPVRVNDFFDQSIIRPDEAGSEVFEGNVPSAAANLIAEKEWTPDTKLKLENKGGTNLRFFLTPAADSPLPVTGVELSANEEKEILASELGDTANRFFRVFNMSESDEGKFKAQIFK